jgi:hypothetical protein
MDYWCYFYYCRSVADPPTDAGVSRGSSGASLTLFRCR